MPIDPVGRVSASVPVRRHREGLAGGDAGIYRTAAVMAQLIRESAAQPAVRRHAELAVTGVPPGQPLEELYAVYRYLAQRVQYRRDPNTVEYLQAPWWVLQKKLDAGFVPQLDCDDLTDLSLAMLMAVGHEVLVSVVSTREDRQFNHVFGLDHIGEVLVPVDLTRAWLPPGAPALPRITRQWNLPVAA